MRESEPVVTRFTVARNVSEDATAHQCQKRYNDTVDPSIKRGPWSADEDASLLRAVEAFTAQPEGQAVAASAAAIPWEDIALFVSGRTKNQCRERYQDRLKPAEKKAKGRWAANEDALLRDAVAELGTGKWKDISDRVGNGRTDAMVCFSLHSSCSRAEFMHFFTSAEGGMSCF